MVEEALCAVHQVVIEVGGGGNNRLSSVILGLQCPHQIKSHNLFKNCHKRLLIILSLTTSFYKKCCLHCYCHCWQGHQNCIEIISSILSIQMKKMHLPLPCSDQLQDHHHAFWVESRLWYYQHAMRDLVHCCTRLSVGMVLRQDDYYKARMIDTKTILDGQLTLARSVLPWMTHVMNFNPFLYICPSIAIVRLAVVQILLLGDVPRWFI